MTIWDFSKFFQIFLLPQVKWCVVVGNNNGLHQLHQELPKELRISILGNQETSGKISRFHGVIA